MKLLIVSDSHGELGILRRIIEREEPVDYLIHLGDGFFDGLKLQRKYGFALDAVQGNNDPRDYYPDDLILKIAGERCLFTHGHRYEVHHGLGELVKAAKINRVKKVFFGHTHLDFQETDQGIQFFNPGSICRRLCSRPGYYWWDTEEHQLVFKEI